MKSLFPFPPSLFHLLPFSRAFQTSRILSGVGEVLSRRSVLMTRCTFKNHRATDVQKPYSFNLCKLLQITFNQESQERQIVPNLNMVKNENLLNVLESPAVTPSQKLLENIRRSCSYLLVISSTAWRFTKCSRGV